MSRNSQQLLVLVDGSSYLHRAFHALPPLTTAQGEPTGAVYGVISMLKKIMADYHPDYFAVVFDASGKNFRHEMYPEYKATRPKMAEDLKLQIEPLHEIINAMGIPLLIINGVEADDVIGTLARIAHATQEISTLISTGDKDLAQLVNQEINLVNTMTNITLDTARVKDKFGVRPEQIVDYLTLVGDSSDNIFGVSGVGPKTAVKWLAEYGTLENIILHQDAIHGKVGEKLRASLGRLPLVKKLVTIKGDLKLPMGPRDLVVKAPNLEKLRKLFMRLEFRTWLTELGGDQQSGQAKAFANQYQIILTLKDLDSWLEKLRAAPAFAFDTETTSLDITQAELVGISFSLAIGEAIYIPFAHTYADAPAQLDRNYVLQKLQPIFADPNKIKLGQNLKYDINILANYGIKVLGVGYDTMIESYILNSGAHSQHNKESLALRYLGKAITTYEDLVGRGVKQLKFNQVPLATAAPYAALDAELVLELHAVLWSQIQKNDAVARVFREIEMPLVSVLARIERGGVGVDEEFLNRYSLKFETRLQELEQQIYQEVQSQFNLNSPQQLQEILYTKLKLPILQKTPAGQPSTAEAVLQELALNYSLPRLILEYRSLSKLKSTYTDALPKEISPKTRRIHTSYNQTVTTTGRLSSSNPNLQNIPIRTAEGRKIRQAFIALHGYKIISADYSQIELRVMAHLSDDENLVQAFRQGADIHRLVAAEIFGVAPEKVSDSERRDAKTINFGLIYGMSAFGLAGRIDMSREEAKKYIDLYFARYPKVREYMEKMRKFADEHGFVETVFGRRLYTPEIKSKNFSRRAAAERAAINAPIQGSAADIIKIAMINIDAWLASGDFKINMVMQVHDELVFEVAEEHADFALAEIKERMETAVTLKVPMLVSTGIGNSWDEAH